MTSAFGNLSGSGNQQVWVNIVLSSQDINGNFSTYYGEVRYYGNGWGSWTNSTQYWSANFGGYAPSGTFTIPSSEATQAYKTLWSGYFTKAHNADGTLAAFGCSASIDTDHSSIGDGSASLTQLAPPTIPRASTPSFVGGAALTTGAAVTINTNWASSGFTHDIVWNFGSLTNQTGGFSASTGIGASLTWTPPHTMLGQIPNAVTGSGTIVLTTKSGSTVIGTKTVAFTMTAAGSIVPTVSSITLADQNATVVAQVGAYVQSLSILRGTVNAAGVQGSTIASSQWSMGGTNAPSGGDITPIASGTVAIGAAATDSRGRVGTYTTNITVMPYAAPKINSAQARRALSSGVLDDNGTYLRIDLNAVVQSLIVGTEKNTLTIKVFTRLYGTSTWTARNVINHSSVSYNTNVLVTGGAIFPVNQSFDVKIEVTDKFNVATPALSLMVVSTAAIFMHWSQTGVGIGKYHTQGAVDVAGDVYANDLLLLPASSNAETQAGSIVNKAVTPASLASRTATDTRTGISELATLAEVVTGTDNSRIVTPINLSTVRRGGSRGRIPSSIQAVSGSASVDDDGTITFTSVTSLSLNGIFDGVGADVYEIYMKAISTAVGTIMFRLRGSGTDKTASYNWVGSYTRNAAGPTRYTFFNTSYFALFWNNFISNPGETYGRMTLFSPGKSDQVWYELASYSSAGGDRFMATEGGDGPSGVSDGLTLLSNGVGTLTGWIKIVKKG